MDNILEKPNIKNSADKINKIYGDLNYYDVYGGSVIIFIILMIVMFLVFAYTTIMKNLQPIKDNWAVERCNPKVIPFAGFINKPDGASTIQYTQDNFNYCMQNILTSITGYAVEPLTYITSNLTSMYGEIANTLNSIRTVISNVRTSIAKIAEEIFGRLLNIMTPIQMILISFNDMMKKAMGIMTAALYTSLGTYYTLQTLLGAILEIIVIILVILFTAIILMWFFPLWWPIAMASTVTFLSISIPLIIILAFATEVLHVKVGSPIPSVPGPGHCFDGKTELTMNDGSKKLIEELEVGNILENNNIITAKLKLDATNEQMFRLGNVVVSGSHRVKYEGKWILVKDHPLAEPLSSSGEHIYCLNTNLKTIRVGANEFADWDEVFDQELTELLERIDSNEPSDIHKYYDGGFYTDAKVEMENGESREISNLEIGSVLKDGVKVLGIVEVSGKNLGGTVGMHGINLHTVFVDERANLEKVDDGYLVKEKKNLRHLITDKKYFYVDGVKYFHYNSQVELFLEKYR
jgi:hypothetical protein